MKERPLNVAGVYMIENIINKKKYIGISNNIGSRWAAHRYRANLEDYKHIVLYKAIKKYGLDNFRIIILDIEENSQKRGELEQQYIEKYDTYNNGYNMTLGGEAGGRTRYLYGEDHPSAVFTDKEVLEFRNAYASCNIKGKDYWEKHNLEEKISYNGFRLIWYGTNYAHVAPELVEKNRERHKEFLKSVAGEQSKKLSDEEVEFIREIMDSAEYTAKECWEKWFSHINYQHFQHIWAGRRRETIAPYVYTNKSHARRRRKYRQDGKREKIILQEYEVLEIIELLKDNQLNIKEIADLFGVSENTIRGINNLETFTQYHNYRTRIRAKNSTYIRRSL